MEFFDALFHDAPEGMYVEVAHGTPPNHREWVEPSRFVPPEGADHFFGPALRNAKGSTKESVATTRVLWADVDHEQTPWITLPPSFLVWSGHGWHVYWLLDEWVSDRDVIERANKILLEDTDGDQACFNCNRLLRVPGTQHSVDNAVCELRRSNVSHAYRLVDIAVLGRLDRKTRHKIRTGDSRGYKTRSERDWAVVQALVAAGADDQLIEALFRRHKALGEKVGDPTTPSTYLSHTIERARAVPVGTAFGGSGGLEARDDGYYVTSGKHSRRVSTFTIEPRLLLDGRAFGTEDAITGSVKAAGYTWNDITFTRSAFTSIRAIDKETPIAAWQWLGRDEDVRGLLPYLMEQLRERGLPRTSATSVLGLHNVDGRYLFVGTSDTVAADESWAGQSGPLVYLPSRREHSTLDLRHVDDEAAGIIPTIRELLPHLNRPEAIWPVAGWYAAAVFKPVLETLGYRFPVLNVHGTKGSGKTTTILRVMLPMFGQTEPKSYDANTTRFVVLSVLGSSNAVPVAFSEFRFGAADKFLRYVLLSYDTGHDPRGRADQTTVDYPLSAPFSVDGEDLVADPAAKERIVAVRLHPADIAEDTDAYKAFNHLRTIDLVPFGAFYIRRALAVLRDNGLPEAVKRARGAVYDAFPSRLPDRVRNNLTVVYFGVQHLCATCGIDVPPAGVLGPALQCVFDVERGRTQVTVDFLAEDLVNAVRDHARGFTWDYDSVGNVLWFQLGPAYNWWITSRRRAGLDSLGRDAIEGQLKESDYVTGPEPHKNSFMYGIHLTKAHDLGLDIPSVLRIGTMEVHFDANV